MFKVIAMWSSPCSRIMPTSACDDGVSLAGFSSSVSLYLCVPACSRVLSIRFLPSTPYYRIYREEKGGYQSLLSVLESTAIHV